MARDKSKPGPAKGGRAKGKPAEEKKTGRRSTGRYKLQAGEQKKTEVVACPSLSRAWHVKDPQSCTLCHGSGTYQATK
jgi:hypothetical protein